MPHEMFGDVALGPSSVRSRRSPVVGLSILVHVVVLGAVFIAPLIATDILPLPRIPTDLILQHEVMPVVVPAPTRQLSSTVRAAGRPDNAPSIGVGAPLVAPTGILEETGLVDLASAGPGGPPAVGLVDGLPGGLGNIEPPPPTPAPTEPIRLHSGIRAPKKIVDVAPIYPTIARDAHAEGMVIIEATIDIGGNVTAARVLRSHALLDQAALDAVRQWKFTPTLLNNVPVPIIMTVTVTFTLR